MAAAVAEVVVVMVVAVAVEEAEVEDTVTVMVAGTEDTPIIEVLIMGVASIIMEKVPPKRKANLSK